MNVPEYLLKANLYGLLFVGCYWLLLRRHTFFGLNRAYLLTSVALSLVLPLISLPTRTIETLPAQLPVGLMTLPATHVINTATETAPVTSQLDWIEVGLMVYGLIAAGLLLRFLTRTVRLLRLVQQSPQQVHDDYVLVHPNDPMMATFSFFQYVILNPADTHNELILRHELVHVRQQHSVDVIFMGIIQAIFWACPTFWLIDRLLRQVHEFLADKPARQPTEYAKFLVDYSFGIQPHLNEPDTLTNNFFNPSLLKQRIIMLHRQATTRWALSKYVLVLPLAFSLLAMTTAREEITAIVQQATSQPITVSGRIISADGKPLSGAILTVANTGKGTPTNAQGNYTLQNVPKKARLSISFVGFTTQVVPVNGRSSVNATLLPTDPNELPLMGATAIYKAIKPNPSMPVRTPPSSETINGQVYTAVEEPAVFPTGIPGLMQYVAHALQYPARAKTKGVQGEVLVAFVVLPTGAIGSAKIKKGIGSGCDEEALRIVRQMPRWIPAKQNSKPVAAQFILPIQFMPDNKEDKRTGWVYPETFRPTDSPIGDFPTIRAVSYPNQPRLTMVNVPADRFRADTISRPDLRQIPSSAVTIRGNGPLGQLGDEPLYILDGVEIPKDTPNPLLGVDANNIESITVLKGSAAVSVYGEKAQNGAVIITTKKK